MEQVTFETDNKKDLNLLIAIAEKLGIKKHVAGISKTAFIAISAYYDVSLFVNL
jgi:hypothetical protein